ncbi:MAG: bifunctional protein HldE [Planctomycetaceae bacterium]|nr:MAG: bifunctional protein HldE [Planctomycetaceae bacterium]
MSQTLLPVLEALGHPTVLVVGDLILDRYVYGEAERISQEAPVILLREERQEERPGGAANVARMLAGLEARVLLSGVTGHDVEGSRLLTLLAEVQVDTSAVFTDRSRPTTCKVRFMGGAPYRHPHQVLRVDRELRHPLAIELEHQLLSSLQQMLPHVQAVLISDYGKGVCTPSLIRALVQSAHTLRIPVLVDPAPRVDYERYRGATAITPNRTEAGHAVGMKLDTVQKAEAAASKLVTNYDLALAYVTLDRDGMVLGRRSQGEVHIPTRPREVCDITGAGDMVLATLGIGLAAGVDPVDLARLANIAGGLEVEQVGVVPITRDQLRSDILRTNRRAEPKILSLEQAAQAVQQRRALGQTVVFTNGCFDLLHPGHVTYLQQAAEEGDCLVVAVNSDRSVRRLGKGDDRPLIPQEQRAMMLASLACVDYVVIFDEVTPHRLLETLRPDVLVKGGTYRLEEVVGREVVLKYGGRVKIVGMLPGVSTTELVRRIRMGQRGDTQERRAA